jgi:hypothetical protein
MGRNFSGHCIHCGTYRVSLHQDHVVPKCKGGSDEPDNIQWLCANCHEDKTRIDLQGRILGPFTDEHKAKISAANIGKKQGPHTEEHKAKISAALIGRKCGPMSEERRMKLRAANIGSKHTPEAKARMSEAQRRIWAERDPSTRDRMVAAMNKGAGRTVEDYSHGDD